MKPRSRASRVTMPLAGAEGCLETSVAYLPQPSALRPLAKETPTTNTNQRHGNDDFHSFRNAFGLFLLSTVRLARRHWAEDIDPFVNTVGLFLLSKGHLLQWTFFPFAASTLLLTGGGPDDLAAVSFVSYYISLMLAALHRQTEAQRHNKEFRFDLRTMLCLFKATTPSLVWFVLALSQVYTYPVWIVVGVCTLFLVFFGKLRLCWQKMTTAFSETLQEYLEQSQAREADEENSIPMVCWKMTAAFLGSLQEEYQELKRAREAKEKLIPMVVQQQTPSATESPRKKSRKQREDAVFAQRLAICFSVFSLGCVFWALLCANEVFEPNNPGLEQSITLRSVNQRTIRAAVHPSLPHPRQNIYID